MKPLAISLLVIFAALHIAIQVCKIDSLHVDANVITDLKKVNIVIGILLWAAVIYGLVRGDFKFPDILKKRRTD